MWIILFISAVFKGMLLLWFVDLKLDNFDNFIKDRRKSRIALGQL